MRTIDAILLRTGYFAAHAKATNGEPPSNEATIEPPPDPSHQDEEPETICAHTFSPEWPWPEAPV